jgi:Flp pilus assembly protein TadD
LEKGLSGLAGRWDFVVGWGGPVDEPGVRNELALILSRGRNYRQAGQQLLRVASLTPTNIDARVGLADMCLKAGLLDLALKYIDDVRTTEKKLHTGDRESLMQTEAWAHIYRNDLPAAEKLLTEAQSQYPLNDAPYSTMAEIYLRLGRITNAMQVLEKELKAQPENGTALNNYARLKILNNELDSAIKLLDHALSLDPKNSMIVFNRAVTNLRLEKLDDAQRDYQTLETTLPNVPYTVYYGLFDISDKKKNPKTAVKYGELYLKSAPKGTHEHNDVLDRIKKIKSDSA